MAQLTFKYSSSQPHQIEAVDAVVNLFKGQEYQKTRQFTVQEPGVHELAGGQTQILALVLGHSNSVGISQLQLQENLHQVQEDNCLEPTDILTEGRLRDFTVEMETGTGKTYVYIRTIYELNKQYGFTKFIIVVPSVAIREGVTKSFQTMKAHFEGLYGRNLLDDFVYDANHMEEVVSFARSSSIQVMIINIDAFNKGFDKDGFADEGNVFHRYDEDLMGGWIPRELVSTCRPIVIIDEPQSVDNTPKAKGAIRSLNPLFVLRYSATHKQKYNMVYRLTPVDAFERKLVKSICVDSVSSEANANGAYIRLESVKDEPRTARLTVDVRQKDGSQKRKAINVRQDDDLFNLTHENSDYNDTGGKGWIVNDIVTGEGEEHIKFLNGAVLRLGESFGDVSADMVKDGQIKQTIADHLQRQFQLFDKGIKVLSLFFLDRVDRYRVYSDDGSEPGEYAKMFERSYTAMINTKAHDPICTAAGLEPGATWAQCFEAKGIPLVTDASRVHEGYFAKDKKGRLKDSRGAAGTEDDRCAFELIMKKKETLISFPDGKDRDKDVSFIFSHSALKEGWDNPNVFQICTLVETKDTMTKRQKIGRGLRLAVNQDGERVFGDDVNVLTVIANESYREFARGLQSEFEKDGMEFGILTLRSFSGVTSRGANGYEQKLGFKGSKEVFDFFTESGMVDKRGAIQPALKEAAETGAIELPPTLQELPEPQRRQIVRKVADIVVRKASKIRIADKRDEVTVEFNSAFTRKEVFDQLIDHIRPTTTFSVRVDSEELIRECAAAIHRMPNVTPPAIYAERSSLAVDASGVVASAEEDRTKILVDAAPDHVLHDPIKELQDVVGLTRKTLRDILRGSGRMAEFKNDPATFLKQVAHQINEVKNELLTRGVEYTVLPESEWYTCQDFEPDGYTGYLGQNALKIDSSKCAYNYVVYDSSTIEKPFAEKLRKSDSVQVFIKLPPSYTIDTPLGSYNPDWAYVEQDASGQNRMYFVTETKGGANDGSNSNLRDSEKQRLRCAQRHFFALEERDLYYIKRSRYESYIDTVIMDENGNTPSFDARVAAFAIKLDAWFSTYKGCDGFNSKKMATDLVETVESRFRKGGDLFQGSLTDETLESFWDLVRTAMTDRLNEADQADVRNFYSFALRKNKVCEDIVQTIESHAKVVQDYIPQSPKAPLRKLEVFISYTRADNRELDLLLEDVAKTAIKELGEERGDIELVPRFDNDDLRNGRSFEDELHRLVRNCYIIMPFISWTYCMRPYCRGELSEFVTCGSEGSCCPVFWDTFDRINEQAAAGALGLSPESTLDDVPAARLFWNGDPSAAAVSHPLFKDGVKVLQGDSQTGAEVARYHALVVEGSQDRAELDAIRDRIVENIKVTLKKSVDDILHPEEEDTRRPLVAD